MRVGAALPDLLSVLEGLRARGLAGPGAVLLESCGPDLPTTRRSILVPRPVLRVEARGDDVRARPLVAEAAPLLELLRACWPGSQAEGDGLRAAFPASLADPVLDDDARLRLPSSLDAVRAVVGLVGDRVATAASSTPPILAPGLFGAFAYDFVDRFEALPPRQQSAAPDPDFTFVLGLDHLVFDRARHEIEVVSRGLPWERAADVEVRHQHLVESLANPAPQRAASSRAVAPAPATTDLSDAAFSAHIERFLEHIRQGDIFQGVLARAFSMPSQATPHAVYRALRATNPSPYMFLFDLQDEAQPGTALLGASPETFLRVEDGELEIRPIAGTAPRGRDADGAIDPDLDGRLALGLLLDQKEQAEHAMLLDLARNDVARVSQAGTCRVVQQFAIEGYSHVQHLVSRVRGKLREGLDALHAYRAVANMGTLTGAPKVKAMQLIREAEPTPRGFYGGAAGYLLHDGRMDTCIVIRALQQRGGVYTTRAGAGVVAHSTPPRELAEIAAKSMACRVAVAAAGGEA